jgi:hypothetical protein
MNNMKHQEPDADWIRRDHQDKRRGLLLPEKEKWNWRDWAVWTIDKLPIFILLAMLAYVMRNITK